MKIPPQKAPFQNPDPSPNHFEKDFLLRNQTIFTIFFIDTIDIRKHSRILYTRKNARVARQERTQPWILELTMRKIPRIF